MGFSRNAGYCACNAVTLLLILLAPSVVKAATHEHEYHLIHNEKDARVDMEVLAHLLSSRKDQHSHNHDHDHHGHDHAHHHQHHEHAEHKDPRKVVLADILATGQNSATHEELLQAISQLVDCAQDDSCEIVGAQPQGAGEHHHHDDHHNNDKAFNLFGWLQPAGSTGVSASSKVLAALLLFIETIIGMLLPIFIRRMSGADWWLSLLNCFAGGIFLTAGLMHLIPHCAEAQFGVNLVDWGLPAHYPLYLFLITAGYLLVFCVERVVFEGHCHGHGHAHSLSRPGSNGNTPRRSPSSSPTKRRSPTISSAQQGQNADDASLFGAVFDSPVAIAKAGAEAGVRRRRPNMTNGGAEAGIVWSNSQDDLLVPVRSCCPEDDEEFSVARGLPLLVGMSVHTGLECLALGLISKPTSFAILFTAIAAHKGVSALALAARFVKSGANMQQVLMLVGPFTLIAPTSIFLGHVAGDVLPASLQLLLNCLACGTFLYVGASEILAEEFEGIGNELCKSLKPATARLIKFAVVLAAVVCIAALGLMPHVH